MSAPWAIRSFSASPIVRITRAGIVASAILAWRQPVDPTPKMIYSQFLRNHP
jgi:hypothetical protein